MAQRSGHRQAARSNNLPRALRVRPRGLVHGLPPRVYALGALSADQTHYW